MIREIAVYRNLSFLHTSLYSHNMLEVDATLFQAENKRETVTS